MELQKLDVSQFPIIGKRNVYYRPETTDFNCLKEVLITRPYRNKNCNGFDVKQGEHWLDLGANIGAFSLLVTLLGGV